MDLVQVSASAGILDCLLSKKKQWHLRHARCLAIVFGFKASVMLNGSLRTTPSHTNDLANQREVIA